MGVKLQLVLGVVLVFSKCTSTGSTSPRQIRQISIDNATNSTTLQNVAFEKVDRQLNLIEKTPKTESELKIVNTNTQKNANFTIVKLNKSEPYQKPQVSSENDNKKSENVASNVVEKEHIFESKDKDNAIKQESNVKHRDDNSRSIDVDIRKYVSPEFHSKNNVFSMPVSSETEKFIDHLDYDFKSSTPKFSAFSLFPLTTPKSDFFDKKFKDTVQSVNQKLEHLDFEKNPSDSIETPEDMHVGKFMAETKRYPNSTLDYKESKDFTKNRTIDKNSAHQNLSVEQSKIINFEVKYNDTKVYDEKYPKGDNAKLETTTTPKNNFLLTTRKLVTLTKPPTNKNNSHILSNKIETDTLKAINTITTDLPKINNSKGDDEKTSNDLYKTSGKLSPLNDSTEQRIQENQIIPLQTTEDDVSTINTDLNINNEETVTTRTTTVAIENNKEVPKVAASNIVETTTAKVYTTETVTTKSFATSTAKTSAPLEEYTTNNAKSEILTTPSIIENTTEQITTPTINQTTVPIIEVPIVTQKEPIVEETRHSTTEEPTTVEPFIIQKQIINKVTKFMREPTTEETTTVLTTQVSIVTQKELIGKETKQSTTEEPATVKLTTIQNPLLIKETKPRETTTEETTTTTFNKQTTIPLIHILATTTTQDELIAEETKQTTTEEPTTLEPFTIKGQLINKETNFVREPTTETITTEKKFIAVTSGTMKDDSKLLLTTSEPLSTEQTFIFTTIADVEVSTTPEINFDITEPEIDTTENGFRTSKGFKFHEPYITADTTTETYGDTTTLSTPRSKIIDIVSIPIDTDSTTVFTERTTLPTESTYETTTYFTESPIVTTEISTAPTDFITTPPTTTEADVHTTFIPPETPRTSTEEPSENRNQSSPLNTTINFVHIKNIDSNHTTLLPEILNPNLTYSTEESNRGRKGEESPIVITTTESGEEDTETASTISGGGPSDKKGTIAAIAISSVGAVCLVLLAGLLYIMRKRQKRFNYGERCRPVSLGQYSMDNVSVYNSIRRKGAMRPSKRSYGNPAFDDPTAASHPLNFPALAKFATNTEDIKAEFVEIPQITTMTSELPEGCDVKNRYANVIPLPETRVFLVPIEGYPNTDYINANYVTGPKNTKGYYIACQGPMQNTVDDFWRMVWEQQSKVILMITHLFENGVEKCVDYLPPSEVSDCHRLFGDFQVTLKKRDVKEKYIISSLQLKNMVSNSWREVTHFWYLGWPEKGVPSEANSLIAFLIEARSYMKSSTLDKNSAANGNIQNGTSHNEVNPVVVHCSPGTGRTGVVIACDIAIREFEQTRLVDIPKIVYRIRRDRASAVQTKEQYMFIYKVVSLYATKLTGGALDSF